MGRSADEGYMRCLYCGNELALLKKLTGYGEFCSEAHRQKYQEQYNRLALTRLLQAQDAEPERRPPLSRTPVKPSSTLGPGKPRREIDSGSLEERRLPAAPTLRPAPASRGDEPPELRGFLPHPFEPAQLSPQLPSADPLLAPIAAFLPISPAASNPGGTNSGNALASDNPQTLPAFGQQHGGNSGHRTLLARPLDLALARVIGAPIRGETVVPFQFSAEYEHTIGDLLCLAKDAEPTEAAPSDRIQTAATAVASVVLPSDPARNGSSKMSGPPILQQTTMERQPTVEPDASLFEPIDVGKCTTTRPPVIINFAALGLLDPEFAAEQELIEERKKRSAPTPKQTAAAEEGVKSPVSAQAAEVESTRPAPPLVPAEAPEAPLLVAEKRAVQEAVQEKVPVLCREPVVVDLRLANDAFRPIDDAEFDTPTFQVRTPTVATCPLRPKVVFGPSPMMPEPIADAPETATSGEPATVDTLPIGSLTELPPTTGEFTAATTLGEGSAATGSYASELGGEPETPSSVRSSAGSASAPPPDSRRIAEVASRLREQAGPAVRGAGTTPPFAAPTHAGPLQASAGTSPVEAVPTPAEKPGSESDSRATVRSRASLTDLEALRVEMDRQSTTTYGAPPKSRRVAVLVALILAVLLLSYLLWEAFAAKTDAFGSSRRVESFGPALIAGEGGWSADWAGPNSDTVSGRQLEVFRPSLTMSDYRFEFHGKIEAKAVGWIFRAVNPRNYYAIKLQIINDGGSSKAVLSRMAIINGEETQRTQTELPAKIEPGTVFKVRTDVLGSTFRTYVQDELADTWIDDRLKIGGIGLLKDGDELANVRLVQLHGLKVVN
jgi:hypothetical protein